MKEGNGFILVFALDTEATFNTLDDIYKHIKEVKNSLGENDIKAIIAGNKCDLENRPEGLVEKAQAFAQERNCEFIETSAKTQKNVNEMFESLVRKLLATAKTKSGKKKSGCILL